MSSDAPASAAVQRQFLPVDLTVTSWDDVQPYIDQLRARSLDTVDDAKTWLRDFDELMAVLGETGSRIYIEHACHTDDDDVEKRFLHWVSQIQPPMQRAIFELQKQLVASPAFEELPGVEMEVLRRSWREEVELFRDENVPLKTQQTETAAKYDKLIGAMLVEYGGETRTLQQMLTYQESTDRDVREQTWRIVTDRRLQDAPAIDDIYGELIKLRQQMAVNAGLDNYRDYAWKSKERFDYSPEDCLAMHDAIEALVVPKVEELDRRRQAKLGLDTLRPWDLKVDEEGRAPLCPFSAHDVALLREGVSDMLKAVEPGLGDDFDLLKDGRNLDLVSRKGKRAGGFQSSLRESREAFIFMNAAGLQRDVETLLHEAGHAFHYQWASRKHPLGLMHHPPLEFAEVASMSMELLTLPHYDRFYQDDEAAANRARLAQLEGIMRFFPWMSTIDAFQHWIYTNPGHDSAARQQAWLDVSRRFGSSVVDWSGLEQAEEWFWQKQGHLFSAPFYYIEYGIAQLGALQMWQRYTLSPAEAMRDYRAALELGGTRPLPDLFAAAGLPFGFGLDVLEPLIDLLWAELEIFGD